MLPYTKYKTLDEYREDVYTIKAYNVIKNIPLVDGPTFSPYASGTGFWSTLAAVITLNGFNRKVIIPEDFIKGKFKDHYFYPSGVEIITHEEVHQLDDYDRDNIEEFINHNDFVVHYEMLKSDIQLSSKLDILTNFDHWINRVFGVGKYSEQIACVASLIIKEYVASCVDNYPIRDSEIIPDYIKDDFREIYKKKVLYPKSEN